MVSKADIREANRVGRVTKIDGCFGVYCAACGRGLKSIRVAGEGARAEAVKQLRQCGWSNRPDGLWRCPEHKV